MYDTTCLHLVPSHIICERKSNAVCAQMASVSWAKLWCRYEDLGFESPLNYSPTFYSGNAIQLVPVELHQLETGGTMTTQALGLFDLLHVCSGYALLFS